MNLDSRCTNAGLHRRGLFGAVVACLMASCQGVGPHKGDVSVQKATTPYDPLLAFVPAGLTSIAMSRTDAGGLGVFAGRDFTYDYEKNTSDWVGISITDFGTTGVPANVRRAERTEKTIHLDGREVTYYQWSGFEGRHHWTTVVDGRYLLDASRREILERALRREGPGAYPLAQSFGFIRHLDTEHQMVFLRRWPSTLVEGDDVLEDLVTYVELDEDHLEFWVRTQAPERAKKVLHRFVGAATEAYPFETLRSERGILHLRIAVPDDENRLGLHIHVTPFLIGWPYWL